MKSTTRFKNNNKGIECLNCKQPIATADNFCSNCGQVNDTKPLSLKQYISELLGGFFAFDTRTINTIIPLLFKPGKVSKAYIKGERMKYVNPFKLYLHTTILFFLITGIFLSIDKYSSLANKSSYVAYKKTKDSITNEVLKNTFQVNDDDFKLKDSIKPKTLKEKINTAAKLISKDKILLKKINDTLLISNKKDSIINTYISKKINKYYKKIKKKEAYKKDSLYNFKHFSNQFLRTLKKEINQQNSHYTIKLDSVKKVDNQIVYFSKYDRLSKFLNSKTKDTNKGLDSLGYEKTTFNLFLYKKAQEAKAVFDKKEGKIYNENIWNFISNMISKSSLVMFFILPLFTLFLSLIYIRRRYNYTEHLIFVFNLQTVFFILLLIGIIFDRIFDTEIGVDIALLLFLFYLYKAMRKFYNQGRVKTILKFFLLNFAYLIFSIFGIVITTFLAFLM